MLNSYLHSEDKVSAAVAESADSDSVDQVGQAVEVAGHFVAAVAGSVSMEDRRCLAVASTVVDLESMVAADRRADVHDSLDRAKHSAVADCWASVMDSAEPEMCSMAFVRESRALLEDLVELAEDSVMEERLVVAVLVGLGLDCQAVAAVEEDLAAAVVVEEADSADLAVPVDPALPGDCCSSAVLRALAVDRFVAVHEEAKRD